MKRVLVVSWSQSGQLTDIVRALTAPLEADPGVAVVHEVLDPRPPYPFPWTVDRFCDAFPEAFQEIPCGLAPLAVDPETPFDLVILAYQVWYLSPSTPVTAFLQSAAARRLLAGRPVVTVIGCRNMWLLAQEKVKRRLADLGARLAGNIVLADRAGNLTGVVTIAYWMLTGRKERFLGLFPPPGVRPEDIRGAGRFGPMIREALAREPFELDPEHLAAAGAAPVEPAYIIFERRIAKVFALWSRFIRAAGGPGDPARRRRVRAFFCYLMAAIVVLAPLATLAGKVVLRLRRKRLAAEVAYFQGLARREHGRIVNG